MGTISHVIDTLYFRLVSICIFFIILPHTIWAQDVPIYSQFLSNPYLYNPAYAGAEGVPTLILTHRRQWTGIEDAPVTSNLTFHLPVVSNFNMGTLITSDNAGIFNSNSILITAGYLIPLGWNHYLSFGISGGVGFQNVDLSSGVNINDPALAAVLENGNYIDGNAGIYYHFENLNVGFSLPKLFSTEKFPTESFQSANINGLENYIITADYMFYFSQDRNIIQPYALYRSYEGYDSQWEAGSIVHINHLIWLGGYYREDFGYGGVFGLTLNGKFGFGYSIDIPATNYQGVNQLSHEFQLEIGFGKESNLKSRSRGRSSRRRRSYRRNSGNKKNEPKYVTFYSSNRPAKPKRVAKEAEEEPEPEPVEEEVIIAETTEEVEQPVEIQEETFEDVPIEPIAGAVIAGEILSEPDSSIVDESHNNARYGTGQVPDYLLDDTNNEGPTSNPRFAREQIPQYLLDDSDIRETIPLDRRPDIILRSEDTGIESGHYVISALFSSEEESTVYINQLKLQGFSANSLYVSTIERYFVYIYKASDGLDARQYTDNLKSDEAFKGLSYLLVL